MAVEELHQSNQSTCKFCHKPIVELTNSSGYHEWLHVEKLRRYCDFAPLATPMESDEGTSP